jgi:hypothetical protein
MPDFDVRFDSGTETLVWADDRLSHRNRNVHRYRRVRKPTGTTDVVIKCVADGVVAPLDGDLDGRLFAVSVLQFGGPFPPGIIATPGQTSLITVRLSSTTNGHQELVVRRDGGGSIILSFEVE